MLENSVSLDHIWVQGDDGGYYSALAPIGTFGLIPSLTAWRQFASEVEKFYVEASSTEIHRTNEAEQARAWHLFKRQDEAISSGEPCDGYVYIMECKGLYKIGRTKNVQRRYTKIRQEIPFPVILCGWRKTPNCAELEKSLHGIFADKRATGEWFALDEVSLEQLKTLLMSPKANS